MIYDFFFGMRDVLLATTTWMLLLCNPAVSQEEKSIIESIRKSWEKLQADAPTVNCRFLEESTEMEFGDWGKPEVKPQRVSLSREHIVKNDGDKFFYESRRVGDEPFEDGITSRIEAYDGDKLRSFSTFGNADPSGVVKSGPFDAREFRQAVLLPIYYSFRPLHPLMGPYKLDNAKIVDRHGKVDQRECVILRSEGAHTAKELWLSPQLDFMPLRIVHYVGLRKSFNIELAYDQKAGMNQLKEWKLEIWNDAGEFFKSSTSTVKFIETKLPIPHKDFVVEFPQNARVFDADTLKRSQ